MSRLNGPNIQSPMLLTHGLNHLDLLLKQITGEWRLWLFTEKPALDICGSAFVCYLKLNDALLSAGLATDSLFSATKALAILFKVNRKKSVTCVWFSGLLKMYDLKVVSPRESKSDGDNKLAELVRHEFTRAQGRDERVNRNNKRE